MSDDTAPLAETVSGLVLFLVGIVSVYYSAEIAAGICFASVAAIACTRSYTRGIEVYNR